MFFKKEREKKKKEKEDKIDLLKKQLLKRIKIIEDQIFQNKIEDGFINLFHTIREFFATILKIKYEFTYEELINEVEKKKSIKPEIKKKIKKFSDKISVIEYSDRILSKKILKDSLEEFRHITKILIKRPIKKVKPEKIKLRKLYRNEHLLKILHTLKLYKTEEEKKIILRKKKIEKLKKEEEVILLKKQYEKIKKIENLAAKALKYIQNNNIDMAKKTYISLNRLYQNSDPEEKKQVYDKVKDVYHEIVTYTSLPPEEEKKKTLSIEKIKVTESKLNNLILNIHDNIAKKNTKKAKILYAISYKLYTNLSLKKKKNIYPKLKKIHNILNKYK